MTFLKQSYICFANPELHEAYKFLKMLSKSLDPTVHWGLFFGGCPCIGVLWWLSCVS
jgi:hypothetical protein